MNPSIATKAPGDPLYAEEINSVQTSVVTKLGYQEVATKAAMTSAITANAGEKRHILVAADESEGGNQTLYLYNGSTSILLNKF